MQTEQKKIKNILVVRNDRFGEFLLNIPALRALRETYTDARIILVVSPVTQELASAVPYVDEVIVWGRERRSLQDKLHCVSLLRKKAIDMAVMLNPSKEFNIFTHLAGIPIRVGYDRKWGFLLTKKMEDRKYLGEKHEVQYNLDLVKLAGAQTKDFSLSLKIDDRAADGLVGDKATGTLVAIHPWTSDPVKQWPFENFVSLANRLSGIPGITPVIVGGKDESLKAKDIFETGSINLTGATTLLQLAALLRKCRLLISGDSGPVHLASAAGTPVLALFRNDLPGKTARRWGPWGEGSSVIEREKLSQISVDEVFAKTKEMLKI